MKIAIIGVSNLSKNFFMLYLSKLISVEHKICIFTRNKNLIMLDDVNCFELENVNIVLENQISIENKDKLINEYDYLIYDIDYTLDNPDYYQKFIFFSNCDAFDMRINKKLINSLLENLLDYENKDFISVYSEIIPESKVNSKYLDLYYHLSFGKNINIKDNYILYFNEADTSNIIENQHDEVVSLKHLSRDYKSVLLQIYRNLLCINKKDSNKHLKIAERM